MTSSEIPWFLTASTHRWVISRHIRTSHHRRSQHLCMHPLSASQESVEPQDADHRYPSSLYSQRCMRERGLSKNWASRHDWYFRKCGIGILRSFENRHCRVVAGHDITGDPGKMNYQWLALFKTGNARVASLASNTFRKLLYIQFAFELHPETISVKSARKEAFLHCHISLTTWKVYLINSSVLAHTWPSCDYLHTTWVGERSKLYATLSNSRAHHL